MVSNEEIRQKLHNKREGTVINNYLVCDNCGGYYELQPGESPEDFNLDCDCGGQLIKSPNSTLYYPEDEYSSIILFSYIGILFIGPLVIIPALYLLTRDNERARFNGKILLLVAIAYMVVIFLASTVIYTAYFGGSGVDHAPDIASVRNSR